MEQLASFGFRPDAVEIADGAGENSPALSFRALVDNIALSGSETDIYLRTGAHKLICRSRRWATRGDAGRRLQFEIQLEKAHLLTQSPDAGLRQPSNLLCS